jgi:pSer/pThr/pTyr-binding forkhead associated (FHA) protein
MAHLKMHESGTLIPLADAALTIGRDASCDIPLDADKLVSRSHAEISAKDGQWTLSDLGSRNGTFVNGRRIRQHPLRDGDVIAIGSHQLAFAAAGDPNATESAEPAGLEASANLSRREREVLQLVGEGLTDLQIGERLFISVNTVRSHLERIAEKTGLRRRPELTRLAIELGLG